jgi:acetylornithine deacetylase/succinyl-diaminopimelate desuccinylase-like protein
MGQRRKAGPPYPPVNLLLVGNEENGEGEPYGTPHVLADLEEETGWKPELLILGERTGERGDERFGEVCVENRGVIRLRLVAEGERAHTGMAGVPEDLSERLIALRAEVAELVRRRFTLEAPDGWVTAARFPFFTCGEAGVYNVTPAEAVLGLEVRPIPEDDARAFLEELKGLAGERNLRVEADVLEAGVACPPGNPHLGSLLDAVREVSGEEPRVGRKMAGTSARFAPGGNAVVWGQTGIGPHSRHERHFVPSIGPYLGVLDAFARRLSAGKPARPGRRR